MDLTALNYYGLAVQQQTVAQAQTAVVKEMLNFNNQLSLEIINQMSQSVLSNNPSNTGLLIDLRV